MSEWIGISGEWISSATTTARQEIEKMISAAADHLFSSVREGLAFAPFAVIMKHDREIYLNVVRSKEAQDASELAASQTADETAQMLWGSLFAQAPSLRAGAVLESAGSGIIAKGPDSGLLPMLRLEGDHRESSPFVASAPWWQEQDGRLTRGSLSIWPGPIALFGPPEQRPR